MKDAEPIALLLAALAQDNGTVQGTSNALYSAKRSALFPFSTASAPVYKSYIDTQEPVTLFTLISVYLRCVYGKNYRHAPKYCALPRAVHFEFSGDY